MPAFRQAGQKTFITVVLIAAVAVSAVGQNLIQQCILNASAPYQPHTPLIPCDNLYA